MRTALELARQGEGRTRPNPPVGAVVVRDGEIVGRGFHPCAGEPHAEVFALRDAGELARGGDLYVTLEPCSHTGRTGPCCDAVIEAGVARVHLGTRDPNPRVAGRGLTRLLEAGLVVDEGLLEQECRHLIAPFARHITTGLPFVLFKGAVTLDGFTATRRGDSRWVSCAESREQVHRLRDRVDAIMVGVGTVLADNPQLTTRLPDGGRSPDRIVVDSSLQIPEDSAVLAEDGVTVILATTSAADADKLERLKSRGVEILLLPEDPEGQVDLSALCRELGERGYLYVLLEGGARLAGSMWRQRLVQRVQLFIAPKLCGGDDGFRLFGGAGVERMSEALQLEQLRFEACGSDIVVVGEVPTCLPA